MPTLDGYLTALPETHAYAVEVRHDIFYTQAETASDITLRKHSVDRVVFDTRGLHAAHTGTPREREAQRKKPNVPVRFIATGSTLSSVSLVTWDHLNHLNHPSLNHQFTLPCPTTMISW
ncbi:MAG TPA: DUF72 domain-containing protein [candidate division Zixibacteria bacterium]|nr:DUF72 domain-containing protein [candidate division Zixibacteria bacterium]